VVEIVNDNSAQVEALMEEVGALSERYSFLLRRIAGSIQHVGVVRFDAFRDMGGMLSFAIAMLDDRGNGMVISSIYGRSESRTYAKPVIERASSYELSPEEREAIRLALMSGELGSLPMEARDREHDEKMVNLKLFYEQEAAHQEAPPPPPPRARRVQAKARPEAPAAEAGEFERRATGERPARAPKHGPRPRRAAREKAPAEEKTVPAAGESRSPAKEEAPRPSPEEARGRKPTPGEAVRPTAERQKPPVTEERKKPPEEHRLRRHSADQRRKARESGLFDGVVEADQETKEDRVFGGTLERGRNRDDAQERQAQAEKGSPGGPKGLDSPVDRLRPREPGGE